MQQQFRIGRPKLSADHRQNKQEQPAAAPVEQAEKQQEWSESTMDQQNASMCEYCGVMFSYRQALDKHIKWCSRNGSDASGDPLRCSVCGEMFKSKPALARHGHVHDMHRPFLCHCGQAYKRYKHLQRHLLLQHNTVVRNAGQLITSAAAAAPDLDADIHDK